jgi:hypothetical protein
MFSIVLSLLVFGVAVPSPTRPAVPLATYDNTWVFIGPATVEKPGDPRRNLSERTLALGVPADTDVLLQAPDAE